MVYFERAVERGPRLSHVENVDKVDIPHDAVIVKSFEIR
jgi:hypothetical protein